MDIKLKNFKGFQGSDTYAFQAKLFINGVNYGFVSNEGRGGMSHFTNTEGRKMLADYAASLPMVESHGVTFQPDADYLVECEVDWMLTLKWLKSQCRTNKTLFRLPGDKPGEYRVLKEKFSSLVGQYLRRMYGKDIDIINERV